ncbi:phenylacetate--CoA ligase family protein [Bacillus sp. BR_7a]|uniref:phenylacetate--CoA ligase family protein n=1 Tax=Bacillus sp. BR_7a TaxID=3055775 RepID=UPI0036591847
MLYVTDELTDVRLTVENRIKEIIEDTGKTIEFWDKETLESFTLESLKLTVKQAAKSNFYQDRFENSDIDIQSFNDFEKLPFTYPFEIKNRLSDILAIGMDEVQQINMSSGTTGGPTTYIAYSLSDLNGDGAYYAPGGLFKFETNELVFIALPYEMATVGTGLHRDVRRQGAAILPAGKGGPYSSQERLIQAIHDIRPTTLFSTPSYSYHLSEVYKETYPNDTISIKKVVIGGEGASQGMRGLIAKSWGAEVKQFYGSTEIGCVGYTCEQGHYHLTAGNAYLEIIDDNGERVPNGTTGKVVLSTLGKVATPLIRYETGDIGLIETTPCECGRTLPRIQIYGRSGDQIVNPTNGQYISPYAFENVLLSVIPNSKPWYHVSVRESGVYFVAERPDISDVELQASEKQFKEIVSKRFSFEFDGIEWAAVGSLDRPNTKVRRIKNEI